MEDLNGVSHSWKISNIVKLCRNNVIPNTLQYPSPHLRILFKGGKNDQYTEGGERVVALNPDFKCCHVQLTLNYFRFLGPSYVYRSVMHC